MAKQIITVRRRDTVVRHETIEVEFPVYSSERDSFYADNMPYNDTLTFTRIEKGGRVTTAIRTREECGRNCTVRWQIETEVVAEGDLGSDIETDPWCAATAEEFEAHSAEPRAWMGI